MLKAVGWMDDASLKPRAFPSRCHDRERPPGCLGRAVAMIGTRRAQRRLSGAALVKLLVWFVVFFGAYSKRKNRFVRFYCFPNIVSTYAVNVRY